MSQTMNSEHMSGMRVSGLTYVLVGSPWVEDFELHPKEPWSSWYWEAAVEH